MKNKNHTTTQFQIRQEGSGGCYCGMFWGLLFAEKKKQKKP